MRASHLTVRKRIMDEKSKITDEEFLLQRNTVATLQTSRRQLRNAIVGLSMLRCMPIRKTAQLPIRIITALSSMPAITSPGVCRVENFGL